MKKLTYFGLLAVVFLACPGTKARTCAEGCESGTTCDDATQLCVKPDAIKCIDGRACGAVCEGEGQTTCAVGQTCQNQRCAPTPASSGNYAACALDADCQRGDFCKLGACSHECVRDGDCKGGTVCSARGRCLTAEQVSQPPPAPVLSQGRVAFEPAALDFSTTTTQLKLTLRNVGGDPYDFRVLSSVPGVNVVPFEGRVSGQSVELTMSVDRAVYKGTNAFLALNTTAGYERIALQVASALDGAWNATFTPEVPLKLPSHSAAMNLTEAAGKISGVVDGDASVLFPVNVSVSGTVMADNVEATFRLVAAPATKANPAVPNVVGREVKMTLKRMGANTLEGTYTEALVGVVGDTLTMSGKVALARAGAIVKQLVAVPDVAMPVVDVSNPFSTAGGTPQTKYANCATECPTTRCQASAITNGDDFFNFQRDGFGTPGKASALLDKFDSAAIAASGDPFFVSGVTDCASPNANCKGLDGFYLRCSQYWYSKDGVSGSPNALLDSAEVPVASALLKANVLLVQSVDSAFAATASFDAQAKLFERATVELNAGFYEVDGAYAPTHPRLATILSSATAATIVQSANLLKGDRFPGVQLSRTLSAIALNGFAHAQWAQTLRRQGDDVKAKEVLKKGALAMYLAALALGPSIQKSPATWAVDLGEVNTQWGVLFRDFQSIEDGRNFLGFHAAYVPFFWNKDNLTTGTNNFQQLMALAQQNLNVWNVNLTSAQGNTRAFEASATSLASELAEQSQRVDSQITAICGAGVTKIEQCGSDYVGGKASEVAQRALEIDGANKRLEVVAQQMANVNEEMKIETTRAQQVSGIQDNLAYIIQANGEKVSALDDAQRTVNDTQQVKNAVAGGIASFVREITSLNVFGALTQLAVGVSSGLLDAAAGAARSNLERQKQDIQNSERFTIQFAQGRIELVNSEAVIATKRLQLKTLGLESSAATINISQSVGRLRAILLQAENLFAYKARLTGLNAQKARQSTSFRVLAQKDARLALDTQRSAMTYAFLATKALGYQLNEPVQLNPLWAIRTPNEMTAYLQGLTNAAAGAGTAQGRTDRISLRDTILGFNTPVQNKVDGTVVSARERFKQFTASPQNRDALGRFHLRFTTNSPANPIFSSQLASDRLTGLKLNLVGDNLGAGLSTVSVRLIHGGTSSLRKRTKNASGTAELVDYDMSGKDNQPRAAQVQAGVNAPNGGAGLMENIEFRERSTLATSWELIIDTSNAEPMNRNFSLSGLDDIELIVSHDAYTIQ